MSNNHSKRRLGRGLAALIGEVNQPTDSYEKKTEKPSEYQNHISIHSIVPNPHNPRDCFDSEELEELSKSILSHGILQPIIVRAVDNGLYKIIAGERRFRAAKKASLSKIPVIIRDIDDKHSLEIAIVENVQRKDLNPLEEALGYEQLISEYGYTQNDLGSIIGKSRSHISNILRILKLPDSVKGMILKGKLSLGHARALILTSNPLSLAEIIISKKMSVRDTEELVKETENKGINLKKSFKKDVVQNNDFTILENKISSKLGLNVSIKHLNNRGQVCIKYKTNEQLDLICSLLEKIES
ncbi:chromosome partitioning protein ParB [Candidatus Liberibacter solanacearum]|uniref:Chromosome (Plasmid) partitioning protein ParB n=1 Tax=Candidatus Liberibacter solanacearum TaxID=556287 RepID=A0A095BGI8_9HYPH|nr:ParB/RepB/Spo0J family partition protein [Candidatus Liberibacter solanacearum]KGB27913.1 chromosome partitioning protein ParB [Candidatus Liberibacter solanacearum]KJZ82150.1 Chromosome (plasmid) partitioning protein ParB [Candidatus Liberibacter solanacearum]KQC49443.1 chromosome partitioning protein ParB [Candidatus Liberibacter solanacearum]